MTYFAIA